MSIRLPNRFTIFLLLASLAWIPLIGFSQAASESPSLSQRTEEITIETVQVRLDKSQNDKSLSEVSKKRLEEIFTNTINNLRKAQDCDQRAFDYSSLHESATEILKGLKTEIDALAAAPSVSVPSMELPGYWPSLASTTLPELAKLLSRADGDLKAMKSSLADLDKQLSEMSSRRIEAPKALADANQRREALNQDSSEGAELISELQTPAKWLRYSQKNLLDKEIVAVENEMSTFDERLEILKTRRDLQGKKTSNLQTYVNALHSRINESRKRDAQLAVQQAQNALIEAAGSCPTVQALAQENADITAKRQRLTGALEEGTKNLDRQTKALKKIRDDFKNIQDRIKTTGFTDSLGILLRVKRSGLPETDSLAGKSKSRKSIISRVQVEMLELDEKLLTLSDLEPLQEELMRKIDPSTPDNQLPFIKNSLRSLLKSQKEFYEAFSKDVSGFFNCLVDLDSIEEQLMKIAWEYTTFIDERVLWIKSCQQIRAKDLQRAAQGILWVFSPGNLTSLAIAFGQGLWNNIFFWFFLLVSMAAIFFLRRKISPELDEISKLVPGAISDRFTLTTKAVLVTLVIASFRPLVMLIISQVVLSGSEINEYSQAVAHSLFVLALIWFFGEFLLAVFLPNGLADIHFIWQPKELYGEIRQQISRLIVRSFPLLFFFQIFQFQGNEKFKESIGRLIFVVGLFVLSYLAHSFFYPPKSTFTKIFEFYPSKLITKLRYLIYFLTTIFPVILAIGAFAGYFYTSQRLLISSLQTMFLFIGVLFLYSLAFRALHVQRRIMALQKAQEKMPVPPEGKTAPADIGAKIGSGSYQEPNLHTMGMQIQKLLLSIIIIILLIGSWLIWEETLPAIRILDRVTLWTTVGKAGHVVTGADGTIGHQFLEQIVPVTLMDLIIALGIGILTVTGSRNIPGFLEFSVLQRLPLDGGIRYAIRTLSSYTITVIGGISLFQVLGIGWEKVQWLVAGMSVGLGFGLQEIFANFVSGLILLFERPIRVGDIITVGDSTGTVSKIEIRATTVIDWDRKELIIPNREFITGKLMNWTLSDTIQRVVFKVGVAYGTDTDRVQDLLQQVARENRFVLNEPAPKALFRNFGDSSLDFELRVYIPNMDNYQDLLHQINTGIDRTFKTAGVEIPFPQRDMNVRTIPEAVLKAPAQS